MIQRMNYRTTYVKQQHLLIVFTQWRHDVSNGIFNHDSAYELLNC